MESRLSSALTSARASVFGASGPASPAVSITKEHESSHHIIQLPEEQPATEAGPSEGDTESVQPAEPTIKPWRLCQVPKEGEPDPHAGYHMMCHKGMAFLFSHLGLTSLVIGYTVMGGFLFQYLEGKTEIVERETVSKKRNATVVKIWGMTVDSNVLSDTNWTKAVERILQDFQSQVVVAIKERGWDGRDETSHDISWSFFGSVLYSVTVLTTIGYGHIAPKTHWGRMTTILYALLGIPLTLLCISTIGSSWANCFRFMYKYMSMVKADLCSRCSKNYKKPTKSMFKEAMNTKGVTVPLWVSLLIIGCYITGGAILFSTWQQDWGYITAAYFCFITLSTIGFGDFVFGAGTDSNAKLITSSLYLFMGLSIIAMCFNLMQEEVMNRFTRIGLKLGIIKEKKKRLRRRYQKI